MTASAYNDARSPSPAGRRAPSSSTTKATAKSSTPKSKKSEAKWGGGDLGNQAGLLPGRETVRISVAAASLSPVFIRLEGGRVHSTAGHAYVADCTQCTQTSRLFAVV